ncbi:MAG: tetratricopeptide repeat protein [Sphingobium sp.]
MRFPIAALPLVALMLAPSMSATAQTTVEGRVGRLEQEVRAIQRKVFPDGAGRFLTPDVSAAPTAPVVGGTPASSQVADLESRLTGVEGQMRTLTGQVEQNAYELNQLKQQFAQYKADMAAAAAPVVTPALPAADPAPRPGTKPAPKPAASATPAASEDRKIAVAAIERPSTGNAADDSYTYGFRLWTAKFYPEAQTQLASTVEKYGSGPVGSRAQNLLGRAYLDDGQYAAASIAFYENYQKRPKGDRASDSLTYLGDALIQLKRTKDACDVYQELEAVFRTTLRGELKALADKGRARAKCGA